MLRNLIGGFNDKLITTMSLWPADSCTFLKASDEFGAFSNMRMTPVKVGNVTFPSREHLFQCCKIEDNAVFKELLAIQSPVGMKRTLETKPFRQIERTPVMLLVNLLHYKQHTDRMDELYDKVQDRWIVEISYKLPFWGAKPDSKGYVGINTLGQVQSFIGANRRNLKDVSVEETLRINLTK